MKQFRVFPPRRRIFRHLFITISVFICCIVFFSHGVSHLASGSDRDYIASLRQAVLRSAVHCYAMEGCYPESLDYLKEHYGISWDESLYLVDYEIIAANLRPDVTVIPLQRKEPIQ